MGNVQYRNIPLKERNDTEKGNFKLNFTKQFCQICFSAKYFPGKVTERRFLTHDLTASVWSASSVTVQVTMSVSLLAPVIKAKRELNISSLYI